MERQVGRGLRENRIVREPKLPKSPKSIVNIVVDRLTIMAVVFAGLGALLIWKGYHGDLLIGGAITCAGAIGAILASPAKPVPQTQDVKVINDPDKKEEVIPVSEQPKEGAG